MQLNDEEKKLLKAIMADGYAAGPFSGMCFNALMQHNRFSEEDLDIVIQRALQVRLRLKQLAQ